MKLIRLRYKAILAGWLCVLLSAAVVSAQKSAPASKNGGARPASAASAGPTVKQIDAVALQKLLKPSGKPLLVNFWATWCDPCREEFPDLVKFDTEFKGKIDFVTVSLDDLAELNRDVPKFLSEMKAEMPAYLLKTIEEDAAIASVSKEWKGGLPFTIMFDGKGAEVYARQGKVDLAILRERLNPLLQSTETPRSAVR